MRKKLMLLLVLTSITITGNNIKKQSENIISQGDFEIIQEETNANKAQAVNIDSYHYCYYDKNEGGGYETNPGWKKNEKELDEVALIVIDPWKDSPFPELNADIQDNVIEYTIPIIESAYDNGVKTLVFTNNPEIIDYDTEIVDDLRELVDDNVVELHYYDEFSDSNEFAQYMQGRGFNTLVYTGYAVEMCVGYRNSGVVSNYFSDYRTSFERYIIPEACLGLVSEDDNENNNMRDMTVMAYSQQNIADVIYFDDWIKAYDE